MYLAIEGVIGVGKTTLLREAAPLLVQACLSVGSPQIRNAGTLGGNVINAAPCADSLPPLVALDATAHLAGMSDVADEAG